MPFVISISDNLELYIGHFIETMYGYFDFFKLCEC